MFAAVPSRRLLRLVPLLGLMFAASPLRAQVIHGPGPYLVKNIKVEPSNTDSNPANFVATDHGRIYYTATTPETGFALWTTNGARGDNDILPDLLAPLPPTIVNGTFYRMVPIDQRLYFAALSTSGSVDLWMGNGSEVRHVMEIAPAGVDPQSIEMIALGSALYFTAHTSATGRELWKKESFRNQPQLVKDIAPEGLDSQIRHLTVMGEHFYFAAQDSATTGLELWKSNGTTAGTALLKDINTGAGDSSPSHLTVSNGKLYFSALDGVLVQNPNPGHGGNPDPGTLITRGNELWVSDGTAAGTTLVQDIVVGADSSNPRHLTVAGNTLYFLVGDAPTYELWKTNGDGHSAALVATFHTEEGDAPPANFIATDHELFFTATHFNEGNRLWVSRGSHTNTRLVESPPHDENSPVSPTHLTVVGNYLYFLAEHPLYGTELWRTDGYSGEVSVVKDILSGTASSAPSSLTVVDDELYFAATDDVYGREVWKTHRYAPGATLAVDTNYTNRDGEPHDITPFGNNIYFQADDGIHGREIWKSDGTEFGTTLVKDILPGSEGGYFKHLGAIGSTMYFQASQSGTTGDELWKTDGTAAGTTMVKHIFTGTFQGAGIVAGPVVGSTLYFRAHSTDHGSELWKTDGTEAGTIMVKDIYPGPYSSTPFAAGSSPAVLGNTVYFMATDANHGEELWKTDGTEAGTTLVKDIRPGADSSSPEHLIKVGNVFYFNVDDGTHGEELWKSDGTTAGTVLVKDINPLGSSEPSALFELNGALYFTAIGPDTGRELWTTDGTEAGTVVVKDINPGIASTSSRPLVVADDAYYFIVESLNLELWKSDGTEAGTIKLQNLPFTHAPNHAFAAGSSLYFIAHDYQHGEELWTTDGTEAGTTLVADLWPGPGSSAPSELRVVGNRLYFNAITEREGRELWAYLIPNPHAPSGGTMTLNTAPPPLSTPGTYSVTFADWVANTTPPLSYEVYLDGAIIQPRGSSATSAIFTPTYGSHSLVGRIYDAADHYTEVYTSFTVDNPLQAWRRAHFGTNANFSTGADDADHDGDGIPNLIEWAFQLDPTEASDLPATTIYLEDQGGDTIQYTYTRPVTVGNLGATFTVQWSDTLAPDSWSSDDITQEIMLTSPTEQTVRATIPAGDLGRRFVRLQVTSQW